MSQSVDCSPWFPPDVMDSFLAMHEAMRRGRYSKVDYLSKKYQKRFPAYRGFYLEKEALAHQRRNHGEEHLALLRAAHEFFQGKEFSPLLNLIRELLKRERLDEAHAYIQQGLANFSEKRELQFEGARLLYEQGRALDAIQLLQASAKDDELGMFFRLLGEYALEMKQYDQCDAAYIRAHELMPGDVIGWCNHIFLSHYMPHKTAEDLRGLIQTWYDTMCAPLEPTSPQVLKRRLDPEKRLRIGVFSSGLRAHPVGWMTATVFRLLSQLPDYEFVFYAIPELAPDKDDAIRHIFRTAATKWRDLVDVDLDTLYQIALEDKLDIAMDLSGHSSGCCLPIMAQRVAPVQVKWVGGLFNTTGVPAMDYLLTDRYETPDGCDDAYAEKLVRLPYGYVAYTPPDYGTITEPQLRPADAPLCFGCFNNPHKINPVIAQVWSEILHRVPGSTLLLKTIKLDRQDIRDCVIKLFTDCGIEKERILCEGHVPHKELIASYHRIDIALDPWPYTGGLTTLEAIWMGVPVITTAGPTFAGRHALSHLSNMGLHELIADSLPDYVERAVRLANNRPLLNELRYLLPTSLIQSPLVRHDQLAADLHTALRTMWRRHCEGLPPVAMRFEQPSPIPQEIESCAPIS